MGASTSQTEIVRDIRADGGSGNGQETYNSMMSQSLPTLSDLEIGDKVELVKFVRGAFEDKLREKDGPLAKALEESIQAAVKALIAK